MKKTKVIIALFISTLFFVNCSRTEKKEQSAAPVAVGIEVHKQEVITKETPSVEQEKEYSFSPVKIKVIKAIEKIDTSYSGDECECPIVEKRFVYRVFFYETENKAYPIEVEGIQVLKEYKGSNNLKEAKLIHTYPDNSDPYFLSVKRIYKILSDNLQSPSNFSVKIGAVCGYNGMYDLTVIDNKNQEKDLMDIDGKKLPRNTLLYARVDERLLNPTYMMY